MKLRVFLSVLVLLVAPVSGVADENLSVSVVEVDRASGASYWMAAGENPEDYSSIIIKFREDYDVRLDGSRLISMADSSPGRMASNSVYSGLRSVSDLVDNSGLSISPLFNVSEAELASLKSQGVNASTSYSASRALASYVVAEIPDWFTGSNLKEFLELVNQSPVVEVAYAEPVVIPAYVGFEDDNSMDISEMASGYTDRQYYFDPAPKGIDVEYTHSLIGGKGENVSIIDVEQGWNPNHEVMPAFTWQDSNIRPESADHGTAVLGILAGQGYKIEGGVPYARVGYESHKGQSIASAIADAASKVGRGGIVLIEVQAKRSRENVSCLCGEPQCQYIAVEYWRATFDAIKKATGEGVIIVEAAGNGSMNLDDPFYNGRFDRKQRDSGAIMVGASDDIHRRPMCWTNYGSRVDVHSWGQRVTTSGYGISTYPTDENREYTFSFGGTSSASAIVAAGVASLQSVFMNSRKPIGSHEMRFLLRSTGTPQYQPSYRHIGPQPNLRAAHDAQSKIPSGSVLEPRSIISSPSGRNVLVMQYDGNFVLYGSDHTGKLRPIWSSETQSSGGWAELKADGNLVVYTASGSVNWQSGTSGNSGAELRVLDSGRIALYRSNRQIWASN